MSSELALLKRVADGDRQALAEVYRLMEKPVYRFIQSRLNDPFESSDILHDVFMEVWRSAGRFEGRSKMQTWIFGIAYRKVIDRHRKAGRTSLTDTPDENIVDDAASAESCLVASQDADQVQPWRPFSQVVGVGNRFTRERLIHCNGVPQKIRCK